MTPVPDKKSSITYLLGAMQRLVEYVKLSPVQWIFVYKMLDAIHEFIEKQGDTNGQQ